MYIVLKVEKVEMIVSNDIFNSFIRIMLQFFLLEKEGAKLTLLIPKINK